MTTISITVQLIIGYVNQFIELNMLMLHITPYALCPLPSELPRHSQTTALLPHSKLHKL